MPCLQICSAASRSLKLMDQPTDPEAAFAELFMRRRTPTLTYDAFWRVTAPVRASPRPAEADVLPSRSLLPLRETICQEHLAGCLLD